jgi:hypothetical protein
VFAPQTGVFTQIGVPKLELQAINIMKRAQQTGLPPELIRDMGLAPDIYGKGQRWLGHWGIVGPAGLPVLRSLSGQDENASGG